MHPLELLAQYPVKRALRQFVTLTLWVLPTTFWLLSVLVVSNQLGLLAADEQRAFASQLARWTPVAPLFIHVAVVLWYRPSFGALLDVWDDEQAEEDHASA